MLSRYCVAVTLALAVAVDLISTGALADSVALGPISPLTDPAKIQVALKATDLKPNQLMMGYKGVKFDDKGQNVLASAVVIQLQDGENYVAVYPKANAAKAPILPYKGW